MDLKGSRVLITGGSLGIGRETARLLVESGAKVGITGRNATRLTLAADSFGAFPIPADVSREADVLLTYERFLEQFGGLDVLVNNAAVGGFGPLAELDAEHFETVWRINVLGQALMAREAARIFTRQGHGNIVNIASTAATRGYENGTIYASTKFALRGMSECWRAELRRHNVRVFTICPSEVTTAFGSEDGTERAEQPNRLRAKDIAHTVKACLEMDDRGFIPELSVFATNPW